MLKITFPAAVGIVALSSSLAFAATDNSTNMVGEVSSWNVAAHRLTLADGTNVYLPATYTAPDAFKRGQQVKISFWKNGDTYYAKSVTMPDQEN